MLVVGWWWWKVEGGRNEDEGLREIFEVCMFACVCGYDYISILNYQHFLIVIVFTTLLLPLPLPALTTTTATTTTHHHHTTSINGHNQQCDHPH